MIDPSDSPHQLFPDARSDAAVAANPTPVPQTDHPAYRLAFQDNEFLLRDDLRPVRFQLELLKAELALTEAGVKSTFVFYGSARIPSPAAADALIAAAVNDADRAIALRLKAKSVYYTQAYELARLASVANCDGDTETRDFVVASGGGPSIMEAANKGAYDMGAPSVGLNIVLAHEQVPNAWVTPGLSFQFHYFALRKMHFLMRAKAVAVFPGGFGTLDELFELLCLVQTGKVKPLPIVLFGRDFWTRIVDFAALADEGVIARADLGLFHFVETAEEAWAIVCEFYART
jgi:uncharacterized protein (TIGR00730 family)